MITTFGLGIRQACRSLNLSRTVLPLPSGLPRVTNPLLSRCGALASDTHGTTKLSGVPCGGRDTRGITKDPSYLLSAEAEFVTGVEDEQQLPVA